jgi:hypothetical protein
MLPVEPTLTRYRMKQPAPRVGRRNLLNESAVALKGLSLDDPCGPCLVVSSVAPASYILSLSQNEGGNDLVEVRFRVVKSRAADAGSTTS